MIKYARNRPSFDATSPHLYRPRSTSLPYPRQPTPSLFKKLKSHLHRIQTLRPRRRRKPWTLKSWLALTTLLIPAWLLVLLNGERWVYPRALNACSWENWETWPAGATPHRLALIADPQLVDPHTYARRGPLMWATMFYTDAYLRRSFETLHENLMPSDVVFLGDLFDGGREWAVSSHRRVHDKSPSETFKPDPRAHGDWNKYDNKYWLKEFARFERIYRSPPGTRAFKSLPGNHDLGFGAGVRQTVRDRFRAYFGELNRVFSLGNHTFVAIDSVSLSNEDDQEIYGPASQFLDSLPLPLPLPYNKPPKKLPHEIITTGIAPPPPNEVPLSNTQPTILLTHVPLYRPAGTPCGPLREKGTSIPIWRGYQYQNVLQPHISNRLLAATHARWVFSGDDHDACELEHHDAPEMVVKEVTVKSASWAMGVRRPAIYLLSLWTGAEQGESVQGTMCYMPDQLGVFIGYIYMGLFTILICCVEVIRTRAERRREQSEVDIPILPINGVNGRVAVDRGGDTTKYWKPAAPRRTTGVRWWAAECCVEFLGVGCWIAGIYGFLIWTW